MLRILLAILVLAAAGATPALAGGNVEVYFTANSFGAYDPCPS